MFVLDTNVLSAVMGSQPVPEVAAWVSAQPEELLFTVSVCQAEILAGIEILPDGRRRRILEAAARAIFDDDFDGRILPFDATAAGLYAELFAARKQAGRSTATADLMIAAVARTCGAHMVTRDVSGFEGCGLTLINPWEAP
ncbi:MAG: toxin FitB [Acetobacteraceae bacterium]|jgi:predicted nucleic acid-binding protein|nr:toxin FitB [Acetobacteraceae bacterium]